MTHAVNKKTCLKESDNMEHFDFRKNLERMIKDEIYNDITFDDFIAAINANLDFDFEDLSGFRKAILLSTADIIQNKPNLSEQEIKIMLTVVLVRIATMTDSDFEKYIIEAEKKYNDY